MVQGLEVELLRHALYCYLYLFIWFEGKPNK